MIPFSNQDEALAYLRALGLQDDSKPMDMAEAALALALSFHPGISIDRYRHHLAELVSMAIGLRDEIPDWQDTLQERATLLGRVLEGKFGYSGDRDTYDNLQNADIIRVIDRQKGLPVALGILYIHVARGLGWEARGLSFPGHFLFRLEKDGQRALLDPFQPGVILEAADLRTLLKTIVGKQAELAHQYYEPATDRDILVRLQNNLKRRLIEGEDYATAVSVLEVMRSFAPRERRAYFDEGVLRAKLGQTEQAVALLSAYIDKTPDIREKQKAQRLLEQIKRDGE